MQIFIFLILQTVDKPIYRLSYRVRVTGLVNFLRLNTPITLPLWYITILYISVYLYIYIIAFTTFLRKAAAVVDSAR